MRTEKIDSKTQRSLRVSKVWLLHDTEPLTVSAGKAFLPKHVVVTGLESDGHRSFMLTLSGPSLTTTFTITHSTAITRPNQRWAGWVPPELYALVDEVGDCLDYEQGN